MKPVLFTIGPYNVYTFGIFLVISFIFTTFIIWKLSKEKFKEEIYLDGYLLTCLVSVVSARFIYILLHIDQFDLNILRYVLVRETPGLSLLGGLFGGFVFFFWYCYRKHLNFLEMLDIYSIATCLGLIFVKIGEQLGGAGFGRETTFLLGVKVIGLTGRRHPTELYEAFWYLILFIILSICFRLYSRKILPVGFVSFIFGIGIVLAVFLLEFLKVYPVYLYGLSLRQMASLILFIAIMVPFGLKLRSFMISKKGN
jgi:phosphatidylglycerol:prolipoprotein diacylglycerol transferase